MPNTAVLVIDSIDLGRQAKVVPGHGTAGGSQRVPLQETLQREGPVMLRVVGGVNECDASVVRPCEQRLPRIGVRTQFDEVATLELGPAFGIVTEPASQLLLGATSLIHSSRWSRSLLTPRGHNRSTSTRHPSVASTGS